MTADSFRAGFDVGGTNARLHLFDANYRDIGGVRRRIRETSAPRQVAEILVDLLDDACTEHDIAPADITAAGVGLAGQLSVDGRTVQNAPNLDWRNVDFVDFFDEALTGYFGDDVQPSIRLVNDLDAQLVGEHLDGAATGIDDVLAVYVGTGIGGAVLADGRLVSGADANAGEIGHSKVVVGGRPCGCGENGCVEAYAGGIHLERRVAEIVEESGGELHSLKDDEGNIDLSAADEHIESHHVLGDIWEEATDFLSLVIANAITLLNPRALLIGGGVFDNCDNFRAMTLQKTVPIVLEVARRNLEIRRAEPGEIAGMLGAAALAADEASD